MPDSAFGLEKERKFPLANAECISSAIKLFGHCPEEKRKELASKIVKASKKYSVEVGDDTLVAKYAKGDK